MKTCRVCGAFVEDKEFHCPECGADMVQSSGKLSLKATPERKEKTNANPMGQSMATGSGLTDILRSGAAEEGADEEEIDEFYGASIPTSMAKTTIDEDYSSKKKNRKIVSKIIKLVILLAAAYGVYFLVTNVILKEKEKGALTSEEAMEILVDGINSKDPDKLEKIIPPYIKETTEEAQYIIDMFDGAEITDYRITNSEKFTPGDLTRLKDEIKLSLNKAINPSDGATLNVSYRLNKDGKLMQSEAGFIFFKSEGEWYFYKMEK